MKNKQGFLLYELFIAFVFIIIIMLVMLQTTINLKHQQDRNEEQNKLNVFKAEVIKLVGFDLSSSGYACNSSILDTIHLSKPTNNNQQIVYKQTVIKLDSKRYEISGINVPSPHNKITIEILDKAKTPPINDNLNLYVKCND